jgi:acyl-homoserine-lactone acylase
MRLAVALSLTLAAPAAAGEILWDKQGVPHIYANTDAELFEGFGYAQAQSHGNLLIKLYGEARARSAEYWGGEANAAGDRYLIANDVPARAARWYRQQAPAFRRLLDGFARGINRYAERHPDKIAPDVRQVLPVTGIDVVAHAHKLMNFNYVAPPSRALAPVTATGGRQVGEGEPESESDGSNGWAVAPSRSASGRSMLLANPHLPYAPSQLTYYEAHLNGPRGWIYGATQVGLPVIRFAFNNDAGFTNTVNVVPGFSRYKLVLDGDGYRLDGKKRRFTTRTASMKIRQSDGSMKTETLTLRDSVHGPVFALPDGATIALRVAGLDRPFALDQYWQMTNARRLRDFEASLRRMQIPMFNLIFADREGHILYLHNGIVPKHKAATDGSALAGDSSATIWTGIHGYDDLPRVVDPKSGFVQNANDPPWIATWPRVLDPKSFPAYMAPNTPISMRAQMSVKLLNATPTLSFDDFVARKVETRSLMAERLVPSLIAAARTSLDPQVQAAVKLLEGWDHRYEADSRAALLFETWASIFSPGNFLNQSNYAVPFALSDPLETPRGLKDPAAAVEMLARAAKRTTELYGALDRPFGEVSLHAADESAGRPGNGGFGNMGIFRTMTWGPIKDGVRRPVHGETWVSMVEFGPTVRAVGAMSYGNATQPGSPHRTDQLDLMSAKTFRPLLLTRAEVERQTRETTRF